MVFFHIHSYPGMGERRGDKNENGHLRLLLWSMEINNPDRWSELGLGSTSVSP